MSTVTVDERPRLADVRRRVTAIFVGSIGNLVEWYDFYAYAAFSLYFAGRFFPNRDPVVAQLNAAILFALGFIVRPIGGWLFGHMADHYGRTCRSTSGLTEISPVKGRSWLAIRSAHTATPDAKIAIAIAAAARLSL